jgi:hypothetical protein
MISPRINYGIYDSIYKLEDGNYNNHKVIMDSIYLSLGKIGSGSFMRIYLFNNVGTGSYFRWNIERLNKWNPTS